VGQSVQGRREQVHTGVLTDHARGDIGTFLRGRAGELEVEIAGLGLTDL
jgi:hypothetical protein